nr:hypothetical protein [Litoribacterium kuwaitense]
MIRMIDLIEKKRDGKALTADEMKALVKGYTAGEIPDYQMSAFLMTIYYKGMTAQEVSVLTEEMAYSGDTLDFSEVGTRR